MIWTQKNHPANQLSSRHQIEAPNKITQITQMFPKNDKNYDEAEIIYEKIKGFSSFQHFFAENLAKMDMNQILNVCKAFKYEKVDRNNFVYKEGDLSNNKFYIILSGEVAVINLKQLGDFGDPSSIPESVTSPRSANFPSSQGQSATSKRSLILSARDSVPKTQGVTNTKRDLLDVPKAENRKPLLTL